MYHHQMESRREEEGIAGLNEKAVIRFYHKNNRFINKTIFQNDCGWILLERKKE